MKIGYAIDKPQTFQTIASLLNEAVKRRHSCTVYSCCDITESIRHEDRRYIENIIISDKNKLVSLVAQDAPDYDAFIGINVFNKGWTNLYQRDMKNLYGVEYCWNEIYNTGISVSSQPLEFKTSAKILCNSLQTGKMIAENRKSSESILSLGSPWFELLISKKVKEKNKKIVFLAPHNSMYRFDACLSQKVQSMIKSLRKICDDNNFNLVLKDRRKYSNSYRNNITWDNIVYDDNPFDHIECYKDAELAISFCSSGINEFTFLEIPYLCVCPEYQEKLNPQIHKTYYSGEIFDGIHCDYMSSNEMTNSVSLLTVMSNLMFSECHWKEFQEKFFTGNHSDASKRILNFIEKEVEHNN